MGRNKNLQEAENLEWIDDSDSFDFVKLYLTIKDIINMIRPSTFKSGECIYDILDNKYYKIISVGDTRVRDGAEN